MTRRFFFRIFLSAFAFSCGVLSGTATGNGSSGVAQAASQPKRFPHGMVVCQDPIAGQVGVEVLRDGGTAVDAAVATAFALAVTHPIAGNIGGGGFLLSRGANAETALYDFRETAPAAATPAMFLKDGVYDADRHHNSIISVGVPGSVAGLHAAWKDGGRLSWKRLVSPAIRLAKNGFVVREAMVASIARNAAMLRKYPATAAQFWKANGDPLAIGDLLKQPDLARTLARIAAAGPDGFYRGETARLIELEMKRQGGLVTADDLARYRAVRRVPLRGSYRGYEVIGAPPPSSGGTAVIEALNILEGYDLAAFGSGSADAMHFTAEAMRRAFADRARYLGDPDANDGIPIGRLISKEHAAELRKTIRRDRASTSSTTSFDWPEESDETTQVSVVDGARNAVSLTTTLEQEYGSKIVVPGAGFILNDEMGDFNAVPGLTDTEGKIGTGPNLAGPGKRMISSMSPTILTKDGKLRMVTGARGGRTIINTTLETILNVVEFGMNVQEAVDAPRFHHQWFPDRIAIEHGGFSPDTLAILKGRGHTLFELPYQGSAQAIRVDQSTALLEGGSDRRDADSEARGY